MMLKKHIVLIGLTIAVGLLLVATAVYPGGSLFDKNAVGFDWSKNFISNLFDTKAVNGSVNPSRVWADSGMVFLSASFALFFNNFSKKIPSKNSAKVIKYIGFLGMISTVLIVTPLHDTMIIMSSTLFLISLFYITIFILKSKLLFLKFLCVICLLIFYSTLYFYGSRNYNVLPIMQKITFSSTILLVVIIEYTAKREDFNPSSS